MNVNQSRVRLGENPELRAVDTLLRRPVALSPSPRLLQRLERGLEAAPAWLGSGSQRPGLYWVVLGLLALPTLALYVALYAAVLGFWQSPLPAGLKIAQWIPSLVTAFLQGIQTDFGAALLETAQAMPAQIAFGTQSVLGALAFAACVLIALCLAVLGSFRLRQR